MVQIKLTYIVGSIEKAGQYEAIVVIMSAMKTHVTSPDVCENGCCALYNIVHNGCKLFLIVLILFELGNRNYRR